MLRDLELRSVGGREGGGGWRVLCYQVLTHIKCSIHYCCCCFHDFNSGTSFSTRCSLSWLVYLIWSTPATMNLIPSTPSKPEIFSVC